jgi:hypothetical protein
MWLILLLKLVSAPIRPDASITPGATMPVTLVQLCTPGYSGKVRHVTAATKRAVFERYGIDRTRGRYEVDHLISLELGGSNAIENLWPESFTTEPYNASKKDALENELHRRVCWGGLPLEQAQHEIAHDWIAAYKRYVEGKRK